MALWKERASSARFQKHLLKEGCWRQQTEMGPAPWAWAKEENLPFWFCLCLSLPHWKEHICASRWLQNPVMLPSSSWRVRKCWGLQSGMSSSSLPAKRERCPACCRLQPMEHSCPLTLSSARGNSFTPEAKEGTVPSKSFTAWANKRGLNSKLARCDTSSQSLLYYSLPSSKTWSQLYGKIVNFGILSL